MRNQFKNDRALRGLLENKSVALVGNAASCEVDAANARDVVVRINLANPDPKLRFDAIYCAGYSTMPRNLLSSLSFACVDISSPDDESVRHSSEKMALCYEYSTERFLAPCPYGPVNEWANILSNEIETKPFTGIAACCHLLSLPIKSLLMTGFNFYQIEPGVFPDERDAHKVMPQIAWLREKYLTDSRLVVDPALEQILSYDFDEHNNCPRAGLKIIRRR